MEKEQFYEKIVKGVNSFLGKETSVMIKEVTKNNGIRLDGLVISEKENTLSPTIYLNGYYEEYEKGRTLGSIVNTILKIYEANKVDAGMDMGFFEEYEKVKPGIFCKIVNFEKNIEVLQQIPHIKFLDLAVVCYYSYLSDMIGSGTILIYESHRKKWELTRESLFEAAMENTRNVLGCHFMDMQDMIRELFMDKARENIVMSMDPSEEHCSEEWMNQILDEMARDFNAQNQKHPMYILTNKKRYLGAVCLCLAEYLEDIADRIESSFYILPSSIHELILIPDRGDECRNKLCEMVNEVNTTQVDPEEVLSDAVYYYERGRKQAILL